MFLDNAYLANLPTARIIHGKGTGILRAAVHAELRKCKYVKRFRLGTYGEGEDGVTIVEFA
jgi:DNA mismatch repair protein MutS2